MTSKTAGILAFLGFILALGGVGGIEQSTTNTALLQSMVISCVGLALMYSAVAALKVAEYYDERV